MTNFVLFINAFLSYLLVFAIIVVLVIVACILGVKWKKSSEAKRADSMGASAGLDDAMPDNVNGEK